MPPRRETQPSTPGVPAPGQVNWLAADILRRAASQIGEGKDDAALTAEVAEIVGGEVALLTAAGQQVVSLQRVDRDLRLRAVRLLQQVARTPAPVA